MQINHVRTVELCKQNNVAGRKFLEDLMFNLPIEPAWVISLTCMIITLSSAWCMFFKYPVKKECWGQKEERNNNYYNYSIYLLWSSARELAALGTSFLKKDCCWRQTFRQPEWKSSSESSEKCSVVSRWCLSLLSCLRNWLVSLAAMLFVVMNWVKFLN